MNDRLRCMTQLRCVCMTCAGRHDDKYQLPFYDCREYADASTEDMSFIISARRALLHAAYIRLLRFIQFEAIIFHGRMPSPAIPPLFSGPATRYYI